MGGIEELHNLFCGKEEGLGHNSLAFTALFMESYTLADTRRRDENEVLIG